jgi:UDP-N-acetylglucosamine 2-epimerase (non-hydrolysing)
LNKLFELVEHLTKTYSVVFPIHPRTRNNIKKFGLEERLQNISRWILTEPLDYFAFQKLIKHAKFILTDSGGIQEETTFRQIPCLTLRENTERPVTVDIGTNVLIPFDLTVINGLVEQIENGTYKKGRIPEMWDGKATRRIVESLIQKCV